MRVTPKQVETIQTGVRKYAKILEAEGYTVNRTDIIGLWIKVVQISRLQDCDYPHYGRTETGDRVFAYDPDADIYFNDRTLYDSHLATALKKVTL